MVLQIVMFVIQATNLNIFIKFLYLYKLHNLDNLYKCLIIILIIENINTIYMQLDLFIALPTDIIQYIWELTDPSIKCITDRKNYFLYYNELYNKINNKQSYIRNIINNIIN